MTTIIIKKVIFGMSIETDYIHGVLIRKAITCSFIFDNTTVTCIEILGMLFTTDKCS